MRLLIDAHALIWYVDQDHLVSTKAHAAITDPSNDLLLSAGTIWEIAIKVGLKKLALSDPYRPWMEKAMADLNVSLLAITVAHADAQASLPSHHRDPFDRLLVAQVQVEGLTLVSADVVFDAYGLTRLW
jgi:PIN domain nuclease of toxin-antitoxin system